MFVWQVKTVVSHRTNTCDNVSGSSQTHEMPSPASLAVALRCSFLTSFFGTLQQITVMAWMTGVDRRSTFSNRHWLMFAGAAHLQGVPRGISFHGEYPRRPGDGAYVFSCCLMP